MITSIKKIALAATVAVATLFVYKAQAQSWYGQATFNHNQMFHSSANYAPVQGNFVMGSFTPLRPQNTSPDPDIAVDLLEQSLSSSLNAEYQISGTCIEPGNGSQDCLGISVVEASTPYIDANGNSLGDYFVIAGQTSEGIFFASVLASSGNPLDMSSWARINPGTTVEGRAVIKESVINPGFFYILAQDGPSDFWVIYVRYDGVLQWQCTYTGNNSISLEARDIIESAYGTFNNPNNDQVIVVGKCTNVITGNVNGFFLSIDASTASAGNPNPGIHYDYNANANSWFNSIDIAYGGFVLGGGTDWANPGDKRPWVTKLDKFGAPLWNSIILSNIWPPISSSEYRDVARVYERKNNTSTTNYPFEYYAVARANYDANGNSPADNLVVYKIDEQGGPNLLFNPTPNEFHYSGMVETLSGNDQPYAGITGMDSGGGSNDGIQVYGNDPNSSQPTMAKAYFNGANNCNDATTTCDGAIPDFITGGLTVTKTQQNQCSHNNGSLFKLALIGTTSYQFICQNSSIAWGDNSRQVLTTDLNEPESSQGDFKLYPNPVRNKLMLSLPDGNDETAELMIYNTVGAMVKTIASKERQSPELMIDFEALQLKSGFYFIKVKSGIKEQTFKIMYQPE